MLDGPVETLTDKAGVDYKDAVAHCHRITDKFIGGDFKDQADFVTQVGGSPGV